MLDRYEDFYPLTMDKMMKHYEAEIAGYKSYLFHNLRGKAAKILEIGIGIGHNHKYCIDYPNISVFETSPNRKMRNMPKLLGFHHQILGLCNRTCKQLVLLKDFGLLWY